MATKSTWTGLFLTVLGLCWTDPAAADGLVLVLNKDDGSSTARKQATSLTRNFAPGGVPLGITEERSERRASAADAKLSAPRIPKAEVQAAIEEVALRYASHPALRTADLSITEWMRFFRANIEIESGYNHRAVSHVGAIGLGQLMPGTAAMLGVDPTDMRQNLDGSARYMLMLLDRFGSKELALAGYNAGPEAVAKYGGVPPYEETQGHVRKVMAVFQRLTVASAQ